MPDDDIKPPAGFVLEPEDSTPEVKAPSGFVLEPDTPAPAPTPTPKTERKWQDIPDPKTVQVGPGNIQGSSPVAEFGKGFWETANPVSAVRGLSFAAHHPIDTFNNMLDQYMDLWHKGTDAYSKGDYAKAFDHFTSFITPLYGPQVQQMEDLAASGQGARALGQAGGLAAPFAFTKGVGAVAGRIGRAAQAAKAAEAAAEAEPMIVPEEAPAATATRVAKSSTPEDAILDYRRARNLEAAKQAYNKASPSMRQQMQQQLIFQNMKAAGGDISKFGELMEESKGAIPLEDHQSWSGATKALQWEQLNNKLGNIATPLDLAAHVIPQLSKASTSVQMLKLMTQVLGSKVLRGQIAKLADIPVNSPKFGLAWSAIKAAGKGGAAITPAATEIDRTKPIYINPETWGSGFANGGMVERIKRNTLAQLKGYRN